MVDEALLELALLGVGTEREEVEDVGILQRLVCKVGLRRRQRCREVRERLPCALVEPALDLGDQDGSGPPVLDSLARVPFTDKRVGHLRDENEVVAPG